MIVQNIDDKHLQSFKYEEKILEDKKAVGAFVKGSAELSIINISHQYNNLYNQWIDILNFGKWRVYSFEEDETNVSATLKLYDIVDNFDKEYIDVFEFPATLGEWATWIGEYVGVPLSGDFPNSDVVLTARPYIGNKNPSFRDAVRVIAKYAGGYARKNYDNTYSIVWFDDTTETTEIDDYISFKHGDESEEVNIVILSSGDTNDNIKYPEIEPENPYELKIIDDFNYVDRYSLSENIFNQVNGFKYTLITKLDIPYGLLNFRAGQKKRALDIDYNEIETFVSNHSLEWNGGEWTEPNSWTSVLKMEEVEETSTEYKYTNSVPNQILEVKRQADKNSGLIEDTIERVGENTSVISQVVQEVSQIQNLFQITGGSNLIKNSVFLLRDEVWNFEDNGNLHYHTELGKSYNTSMIGSVISRSEMKLQDVILRSTITNIEDLKNDSTKYTINFYYKQDSDVTTIVRMYDANNNNIKVFEDYVIEGSQSLNRFSTTFNSISSNYILEFETSTTNAEGGAFYLYDLMLNSGEIKSWEPAQAEIYSTKLTLSREGLKIFSSGAETLNEIDSTGNKVYESSDGINYGRLISQVNKDGTKTINLITEKVNIKDSLDDNYSWVNDVMVINNKKHLVRYYMKEGD